MRPHQLISGFGWAVVLLLANPCSAYDLIRLSKVENPNILGNQGNANALRCTMSNDGSVIAFDSNANNLILHSSGVRSDDENGKTDSFIDNGSAVTLGSITETGDQIASNVVASAISGNGRYLAFLAGTIVYRRDLQTNTTVVVDSVTFNQLVLAIDNAGRTLAISDNGRYIAYVKESFLVNRWDGNNGNIIRVNPEVSNLDNISDINAVAMDGSGQYIAFDSASADYAAADTNGVRDVFLHDVAAGTNFRVSLRSNGNEANGASYVLDVSNNGGNLDAQYVLFASDATNLDAALADTNNGRDVFRHNRFNANTIRVSKDSADAQFLNPSDDGRISSDGARIIIRSRHLSSVNQLYRKGILNGQLIALTDLAGGAARGFGADDAGDSACFISAWSSASATPNDTNVRDDVYRVDVSTPGPVIDLARVGMPTATVPAYTMAEFTHFRSISANGGRLVVETTTAHMDSESFPNLNTYQGSHLYFVDRLTGVVSDACLTNTGAPINRTCRYGSLSSDGRFLFFVSDATNLEPGMTLFASHIYRRDLLTGEVLLIDRNTSGQPALNGGSTSGTLDSNANGTRMVFTSLSSELVTGDTNNQEDVFVWDQSTGVSRVSISSAGVQSNGRSSGLVAISEDGQFVFFSSEASNLVSGDTNSRTDIFMRDILNNSTSRIGQPGAQTTQDSILAAVSPDGRFVEFASTATEFTDPENLDRFMRDRLLNTLSPSVTLNNPNLEFRDLNFGFDGKLYYTTDDNSGPSLVTTTWRRNLPSGTATALGPSVSSVVATLDGNVYGESSIPLDGLDNNGTSDVVELPAAPGYVLFSQSVVSVAESAFSASYGVQRRNGAAGTQAVVLAFGAGTAVENQDYTVFGLNPLNFTFQDGVLGEATSSMIRPINDNIDEPDETIILTIADPAGLTPLAPQTLTITILDDDVLTVDPIFLNGFE